MKRTRDKHCSKVSHKFPKIQRLSHFFQHLPHEVLIQILDLISRADLIALSTTSRTLRRVFVPYLFAHSKVSWGHLVSNWKNHQKPVLISSTNLIETLRLTDHCSKNEWTFPFADLFSSERLPNLKSFELCTSGSTNFFKYSCVGSHLKRLKVCANRPGSVFSLEHMKSFGQLEHLSLQDYEIEAFEEHPEWCPRLIQLELIDCSWYYPFQLENFGRNKVKTLKLVYSNAFIISERFKMFLSNPNFENLSHLEITNEGANLKLTLSVQIMKLIESIPTLKIIKLNGNIYNETLQSFTSIDLDNCINYVALNNVKIFYSSFFQKQK